MAQETIAPRKMELGPRWSSEEINIFFESKQNKLNNCSFQSLRQRLDFNNAKLA